MALTVKHLNSDASFLISFEPIIPESIAGSVTPQPFTILLDPWITGATTIIHPKISITSHKQPACISSLTDLPRPPDVVIVSQAKPDHCNEATLRQLPRTGTKTLILAEPASARIIRSWRYFDKDKIRTIERWEDPRVTGKQSVVRIPVPALQPGGQEGEVTVAFIPQKRDLTGLHGAIGITYRPPHMSALVQATAPSTPPSEGQKPTIAGVKRPALKISPPLGDTFLLPPTPPMSPVLEISPASLRSTRSASTLITSSAQSLHCPPLRPATSSQSEKFAALRSTNNSINNNSRPISLIFSPHGIPYSHLAPYATSHLVSEAALPLTALLHCMDSVRNPWWLGGVVSGGTPYGAEIAARLGARVWVSAHDGEKHVRGLATRLLKSRRWEVREIEGALGLTSGARRADTDVLRLRAGEEIRVSGTVGRRQRPQRPQRPDGSGDPHTPIILLPPTLHRKHYEKKPPAPVTLPNVQDDMLPKQLGVYKTFRTRELLRPSPKLVLEQSETVVAATVTTTTMTAPCAESAKGECVGRGVSGVEISSRGRVVRFQMSEAH